MREAVSKLDHWCRIVRRYEKVIAELRQIIADGTYYNGLPKNQTPDYVPLDLEWDRVMLAKMVNSRNEFLLQNPRPEGT